MNLESYRHWVFDMDGTLTLAVHDFAAIRQALDIPPEADILHHLAALPAELCRAKHNWLLEHERQLALAARPAQGAVALVRSLHQAGLQLGILTRNAHELALLTLQAIGLADCFAPENILGRDEAAPKPDPAGLLQLAGRWRVEPQKLLMIGDHHIDLACGRAAGATTVLINQQSNPWPELSDYFVPDCNALQRLRQA